MPDRITLPFWLYMVLMFFLVPGMVLCMDGIEKKWKKRKSRNRTEPK